MTGLKIENQKDQKLNQPTVKTRLFYNPIAGTVESDPALLSDMLSEMQDLGLQAEVTIVKPDLHLSQEARLAVEQGFELVIACGGDGTIDNVAAGLVGTEVTLGILPGGTRNNIARSLNIPALDVGEAVTFLRHGRRIQVDVGEIRCGQETRHFLEACSIGLLSDLFPAADELQKGKIGKIGDLLTTLVGAVPASIDIDLEAGQSKFSTEGHIVLVANMPYLGAQVQLAPNISYEDGLLDLLVFADIDKAGLLGVAVQAIGGIPEDKRIHHYKIQTAQVRTEPKMKVISDGFELCDGDVEVKVLPKSLWVMAGPEPSSGEGYLE